MIRKFFMLVISLTLAVVLFPEAVREYEKWSEYAIRANTNLDRAPAKGFHMKVGENLVFTRHSRAGSPGNPRDKKDDKPDVLSLPEARDKVTSLQKERQDMKSRLLLQKKIALSTFELEEKNLKDIINTPIPPKGEFETTSQYDARLRKHREKIKPAKIRYEADYNAILEKFVEELRNLDKKYTNRIETILNLTYPAEGLKIVPIKYNADEQVYRLKVIEKDGRFREYQLSVEPRIAKGIYQRRNSLNVEGFYTNIDALFLIKVRLIDPLVGKPDLEAKTFRAECKVLNFKELIGMLHRENFFDKVDNPSGEFPNLFELKTSRGDNAVIDRAAGLMWHRSGSSRDLQFEEAKEWVKDLNIDGYAGYHDWRLPTSEEATSLLEKIQQDLLYIDPLFSSGQANIWTCDKTPGGRVWAVLFSSGNAADYRGRIYGIYVRPVRSGRVKGKLVYQELHEKK